MPIRRKARPKKRFDLEEIRLKDAWSVDEFCKLHSISRPTFFNYLHRGVGPAIRQPGGPGGRILITREARDKWMRRLEMKPLRGRGRPRKEPEAAVAA